MTKLVGILNVTPDSFSDGGKYTNVQRAIDHAEEMFHDGASIVDVGAESTRPNARELTPEEEWQRLEPVLKVLIKKYPGKISLDSYHPETVKKAFKIGPVIVNDVTGMNNPLMVDAVIALNARTIISHLSGTNIQLAHRLMPIKSVNRVKNDLLEREVELISRGLDKHQIILDPGIGFGKTPEVNKKLLRFAELLPDHSIMIGYSRKRFLGDRRMELQPNLDAGRIAIASGANYLRVHDVAGHKLLINKN